MSRSRRACVAGVVALSLSLAACSSSSGNPGPPASSGADVGVEHVHGLGVDPADGTLYAATHFGLWRIPENGEATRVADRYQDTMGFTVVGPGAFLGSGHPDFQMDPDLPTRLGLIRSSDAGETWENVSLGGEADFHVLHAVHGNVYAWEAGTGRVMVSGDEGQTWETRSSLELRDLVVSPDVPETLLATTETGLVRSTDGARTWSGVSGAPILTVLVWASERSLYGVTPEGLVQHSTDAGTTWTARGEVSGQPEALTVVDSAGAETLYVAVSDAGILISDDGGATFTVRYAE